MLDMQLKNASIKPNEPGIGSLTGQTLHTMPSDVQTQKAMTTGARYTQMIYLDDFFRITVVCMKSAASRLLCIQQQPRDLASDVGIYCQRRWTA